MLTVTRGVINNGVILVKDGKVQSVVNGVKIPEDYALIDAAEKWIMPGMIELHSRIGFDAGGDRRHQRFSSSEQP